MTIGSAAFGLACLCLLALAAIVGPATAAAAECPNEAIRSQQGAGQLPDCRAYEQVSPVDKGSEDAKGSAFGISTDGDRVGFKSFGAFAGAQGDIVGNYRSERTPTGWQTISLVPPFTGRNASANDAPEPAAVSADFSRVLFETEYPLDPLDQGQGGSGGVAVSKDLYMRNPDGSFTWVSKPMALPDLSAHPTEFVAASTDLSRILMRSNRILAPGVSDESVTHLYLYVDGKPTQLVDVALDGNPVSERPFESSINTPVQMSADGTRVAFVAGPNGALKLYLRLDADDPALARTVDVGSGTEGRECSNATLLKLSADGNQVLFECPDQLTDEPIPAGLVGMGLYLRDLSDGSLRLLGAVKSATVLGATSNFSDVYFALPSSSSAPGGIGVDGKSWGSIARLHEGTVEVAVPTQSTQTTAFSVVSNFFGGNWLSANGRYLAFTSSTPLGYPTPAGKTQVYRYDGGTGELSCVSCRSDGGPTAGEAQLAPFAGRYQSGAPSGYYVPDGAVSNEGEVFFNTGQALVPRDQNGKPDGYVWRDGQQYLLGSGADPDGTAFMRASADGKNAFFLTTDSLVPQDVDGGTTDLYDARTDGGFPAPEIPTWCSGDSCQGPPAPAPAPGVLGSVGFSGAGNSASKTRPVVVSLSRHRGGNDIAATLRVKVSTAGRISLSGGAVRALRRGVGVGAHLLPVRLKETAAQFLRRRGRLKAKVKVSFVPTIGGRVTKSVKLGFSRSKSGRVTARLLRGGN
jgi:hypothetical protein